MARYVVVTDFKDLEDKNHVYRAKDEYPREGKATKKRIDELSTKNNNRKTVFIKEVDEK